MPTGSDETPCHYDDTAENCYHSFGDCFFVMIHPVNCNDIRSLLIDVHEIPISMHTIH